MTEKHKTFVEEEAQWAARAAIDKILQHGDDALSEAQGKLGNHRLKEILPAQDRGSSSAAEYKNSNTSKTQART